ncbi:hypothetical protein PMIN06_009238 [Paraphaeosphaeria minitans]
MQQQQPASVGKLNSRFSTGNSLVEGCFDCMHLLEGVPMSHLLARMDLMPSSFALSQTLCSFVGGYLAIEYKLTMCCREHMLVVNIETKSAIHTHVRVRVSHAAE